MNEVTVFALALLAVPVFARFARVAAETRKIYHLIGLAGLLLLMGETTRIVAGKVALIASIQPGIDFITAILALLAVIAGTVGVTLYYFKDAMAHR